MKLDITIDFDGTVALDDTTDLLLQRFADPKWLEIETEWVEGRIGSRECLAQQIALLHASAGEIDATLEEIKTDLDFPRFVEDARALGATTKIISDGFDRLIEPILARIGVKIPLVSSRLVSAGPRAWRTDFPNASADCRSESGVCKCAATAADQFRLLIGDSRSDFCLAQESDLVFAKGKLADYCREQNIPHRAIASFRDARAYMNEIFKLPVRDVPADVVSS